jgi:translation elongation factor EF-1beta
MAYLVGRRNYTLEDAFQLVLSKRPIISPIWSFFRQLVEFEKRHCDIEETTLKLEIPDEEIKVKGEILEINALDVEETDYDELVEKLQEMEDLSLEWLKFEKVEVAYGIWKVRALVQVLDDADIEELALQIEEEMSDYISSCRLIE